MSKIKALCLIVLVAATVPVFGQRQVSQDRYNHILDSIKAMPKVTAVNLYAEYEKNGISWEDTYKENYRILTGTITNLGRDVLGMERVISLKTRSEVIKGVPGYRTIDVVYPEKLPENVKQTLATYKVGQNVEIFVRFRKTPDSIDAVYYNETLPFGYSVQLYRVEELCIIVPDTAIGKTIIIRDEDGKKLVQEVIKWVSMVIKNTNIVYYTYSIEIGDFIFKKSHVDENVWDVIYTEPPHKDTTTSATIDNKLTDTSSSNNINNVVKENKSRDTKYQSNNEPTYTEYRERRREQPIEDNDDKKGYKTLLYIIGLTAAAVIIALLR